MNRKSNDVLFDQKSERYTYRDTCIFAVGSLREKARGLDFQS